MTPSPRTRHHRLARAASGGVAEATVDGGMIPPVAVVSLNAVTDAGDDLSRKKIAPSRSSVQGLMAQVAEEMRR
jgi:hypothetical protein